MMCGISEIVLHPIIHAGYLSLFLNYTEVMNNFSGMLDQLIEGSKVNSYLSACVS